MANAVQDDRFAPPQAIVDDVRPASDGPELAGRWIRLAAAVIDTLLAAAAIWLIAKLTSWNVFGAGQDFWAPKPLNTLAGIGVFLVLQGYMLATRAQTLGKALLKLRITRTDGSKPSAGRLIGLRYGIGFAVGILPALAQIYAILDCLLIFRASRKCLHDSIADTIVIKA